MGVCPNLRLASKEGMEMSPPEPKGWNYCIEIFVFMEVRWRICNHSLELVKNFQTSLMLNVLKKKDSNLSTELISKRFV